MFRFRLETLLRLRVAERDQRRAEFAKAIRAEEMLRSEERKHQQEQVEAAQRGRVLRSPGAADVDAIMHTHRYEVVLAAKRRQLAAQIAQVQTEVERRRQVVVEADRQVRVLEKLRERQAVAYRRQVSRREAKQYDETAALNYLRRKEVPS